MVSEFNMFNVNVIPSVTATLILCTVLVFFNSFLYLLKVFLPLPLVFLFDIDKKTKLIYLECVEHKFGIPVTNTCNKNLLLNQILITFQYDGFNAIIDNTSTRSLHPCSNICPPRWKWIKIRNLKLQNIKLYINILILSLILCLLDWFNHRQKTQLVEYMIKIQEARVGWSQQDSLRLKLLTDISSEETSVKIF